MKCRHIGLMSRHMKTVSKYSNLKMKVSTHDIEVSTYRDRDLTFELTIKSRHMTPKCRHLETVYNNWKVKTWSVDTCSWGVDTWDPKMLKVLTHEARCWHITANFLNAELSEPAFNDPQPVLDTSLQMYLCTRDTNLALIDHQRAEILLFFENFFCLQELSYSTPIYSS